MHFKFNKQRTSTICSFIHASYTDIVHSTSGTAMLGALNAAHCLFETLLRRRYCADIAYTPKCPNCVTKVFFVLFCCTLILFFWVLCNFLTHFHTHAHTHIQGHTRILTRLTHFSADIRASVCAAWRYLHPNRRLHFPNCCCFNYSVYTMLQQRWRQQWKQQGTINDACNDGARLQHAIKGICKWRKSLNGNIRG